MNRLPIVVFFLAIFLTVSCPVFAASGDHLSREVDLPSNAHIVFFDIEDGKIRRATECYFDRASEQCRIDTYLVKEDIFSEDVERISIERWAASKKGLAPEHIEIFGADNKY